jgi:hypothetical protein
MLYNRKTSHLEYTEIFYTGFCSGEKEKVVFFDKAKSCIVGIVDSGITSPTSDFLL